MQVKVGMHTSPMVKRSDIPQPPCSPATVPSGAGRKAAKGAAPSVPVPVAHNSVAAQPRWASRLVGEADVDPRKLIPNVLNWRKHPRAQQVALGAALDELGWIQRVIVNQTTGNIVDGHLRVELALKEHERTVPVCYVNLTPEEEQLALATFDPLSAMATTDQKTLDELLAQLNCTNEDLAQLLKRSDEGEDSAHGASNGSNGSCDSTPTLVPPTTRPGDVWQLGEHRLLCGDCRNEDDLRKLFGDTRINVAITSPPYAAQRDYDKSSGFKPIFPDAYVEWFSRVSEGIADYLVEDGSFFLNIKEHCEDGERVLYVKDLTLAHVRDWHWRLVDELIWIHGGTPKACINRFKNAWEPIFHFTHSEHHKFRPERVRHESSDIPDWGGEHPSSEVGDSVGQGTSGNTARMDQKKKKRLTAAQKKLGASNIANGQGNGDVAALMSAAIYENVAASGGMAYPSNVLSVGKNRESLGHSAAFPVALPEFFIKAFSDQGDVVFDPFMGSGSTLIAAERLHRRAYGTEISPTYCDIIVARWELYTVKKAKRVQAEQSTSKDKP